MIALLLVDLYFHRKHPEQTFRQAVLWTMAWISLAFLFNLYVYWDRGAHSALEFLTGYVIEQSLSVDNLFVIMVVLSAFSIAKKDQHRVLFWGVLGAFLMRGAVIFGGISLINSLSWVTFVFGGFLILTGLKTGFQSEKKSDEITQNRWVKWIQTTFKLSPFMMAIIIVEFTDLVFAIDSIPAILSITKDPFIVVTSNLFAIMGLRSMYFVVHHFLKYFHYLRYGLAAILTFVGSKMVLEHWFHIPVLASLMVVLFILTVTILASLVRPNRNSDF
jgi:tellurite resistance protein TerC